MFAIEFTMPVSVALLAAAFLGERLRAHRLVQLACGLAGVLIILRPGADTFHPAALVMILAFDPLAIADAAVIVAGTYYSLYRESRRLRCFQMS